MNKHRFILEKYNNQSSRYTCPNCGIKNTFTRYIDTLTGNYIHETVGRCNRQDKCGYHYPPKTYFNDNNLDLSAVAVKSKSTEAIVSEPSSYINFDLFQKSLACYEQNNFVQFLVNSFGTDKAREAVERFYIGTSKKWQGATVFWQVDSLYNIRTGKIMLYDTVTSKRVKNDYNHISWVHRISKTEPFNLSQCFFGEHLLSTDKEKKVAIVESEKTAVIAALIFPQFIWLATGGKEGLSEEKAMVLKGRNVILFPDAGCYDHWKRKAKQLVHICNIDAHGVLETNISKEEKKEGYDIADYLIKYHEEQRSCSCSN
jgi:hypothetical protein